MSFRKTVRKRAPPRLTAAGRISPGRDPRPVRGLSGGENLSGHFFQGSESTGPFFSGLGPLTPALPRSPAFALRNEPCRGNMLAVLVGLPFGGRLLRTTRRFTKALERYMTSYLYQNLGHRRIAAGVEHLPVRWADRHHHPGVGLTDLQRQVIRRQLLLHHFLTMRRTQRRLQQRYGIAHQQTQTKREQRRLRITQRVDLARQGLRCLEKQTLNRPPFAVDLGHLHRRHFLGRQIRKDVKLRVAIARRLAQLDRDPTDLEHLPFLGLQAQALLVDRSRLTAPFRLTLAQQRSLKVAMLTDHQEAATTENVPQQTQRAKVAIRHPNVLLADQGINLLQ